MPYKDASGLKAALRQRSNPRRAHILMRYFKTGKGEYGEGDVFLGVQVGDIRKTVSRFEYSGEEGILDLLTDPVHEYRLAALLVFIRQYRKEDSNGKNGIVRLYLSHTKHINNWDLVDLSAGPIVGAYVYEFGKFSLLKKLSHSPLLWERRIAMVATLEGIRRGRFDEALSVAETLLSDESDLIHKAVGWMLREIGKRDRTVLTDFLDAHASRMPRTALRYAIERFDEKTRRYYRTRR